jgi:hypothetical protein
MRSTLLVLVLPFLVACSSNSHNSSGPMPATNQLSLQTGTYQVPAGGDWFECFYTSTITATDLVVGNVTAQQGLGGHHIIVYYVDTQHPVEHHECVDSEMIAWHQIAGAANGGEAAVTLPPSTGLKVPAGKQIVVQSHYINTTGMTETVNDSIGIDLLDPSEVKAYLNNWVINDGGFSVPANGTGTSATACTVAQDLEAVIMLGHMHEYGAHHTLDRIDAMGNSLEVLYDHAWQPQYSSHPPLRTATIDAPFLIPAGTRIRQTCTWNNTTPNVLTFPTEMCAGVVYYFPDNGFQVCDNQPVTP